jgi:hypothetical protein
MNRESGIRVLARLRRSRAPLGRALLALFTTTWLGLALQPCTAEASQPGDEAPPAAAPAQHEGCGGGTAPEPAPPEPMHDCPHCPPGGNAGDCGTALYCGSAGVPGIAAKSVELPRADPGAWLDLPVPLPQVLPDTAPAWVVPIRQPRAAPRPLQQRYCRYRK